MTDKRERWKQLLLKVEALCTSLEERVFRPKVDFVTSVEEWVSMTGVRQKLTARFMSWRQCSSWVQKSNGMNLQEAVAVWFSRSRRPRGPAARSRLERRHFRSTFGRRDPGVPGPAQGFALQESRQATKGRRGLLGHEKVGRE